MRRCLGAGRNDAFVTTGSALAAVLRRRIWWVLGFAVLAAASAFAFSYTQTKEYSASASVLVRDPGADADREAATTANLFRLDVLVDRTERRLGLPDLQGEITTSSSPTSNILSVSATDRRPRRAATIANTFAQEFIAFRRDTQRALLAAQQDQIRRRLAALSDADRRGAQGATLRARITNLEELRSIQSGNATVVEPATPPRAPSSPRKLTNTALGGAVGLLIGLIIALLLEGLDSRVRDTFEVQDVVERPILGFVPRTQALKRRRWTEPLPPSEADVFRTIRTNLWHATDDGGIGSVLVTSPGPKEGKSTVAWNLAAATTSVRENVLLVEGDLRHPSVAAGRGLRPEMGLTSVLAGEIPASEAIQTVRAWPEHVGTERYLLELDVLVAGPPVPDSGQLVESPAMVELLADLERQYDFIVVDGPPASLVFDAVPLMTLVAGTIIVVRLGATKRDAIVHLRDQIASVDSRVIGTVVNFARERAYYGVAYSASRSRGREEFGSPGDFPLSRIEDTA